MKKALVHAHTAYMITQFNMDNIRILLDLGYEVDVACCFEDADSAVDPQELSRRRKVLTDMGVRVIETASLRRIFDIKEMLKAYRQLKEKMDSRGYDIIHTQSPIGGVICRLAARDARKNLGTKVIYEGHGFHFFKGAPLKNWLIYYNAEKFCSRFTDLIITINQEDYKNALSRLKAKDVVYVPGVGVDVDKFSPTEEGRRLVREELNISDDTTVILSLGELIKRKNHESAIKALAGLNASGCFKDRDFVYLIGGRGKLSEDLKALAYSLGIGDKVKLLGFRTDSDNVFSAADIYLFPSFQEGLPVALMEAMTAGLPVAASRVRGNVDLITDGGGGYLFDPFSVKDIEEKLKKLFENEKKWNEMGEINRLTMGGFTKEKVNAEMKKIYERIA